MIKSKLLYIADYFKMYTDENHHCSFQDIFEYLREKEITINRHTFYDDIRTLQEYGLDIISDNQRKTGYFLASREFEIPELKLLVDSIQSSKFITMNKTLELIKKIESLCSSFEAKDLQRDVFVRNRIKSMNESVYYNVDSISEAIGSDKKITFNYFEYNINKERVLKHNGKIYKLSPFSLILDNENYYLIAYDSDLDCFKHFRIDKMVNINLLNEIREGKEKFKNYDISSYNKKVFSMFNGEIKTVKLRFKNYLVGAALDTLGQDVHISPDGDSIIITTEVAVSSHFLGWIFSFGKDAEILWPTETREYMKEYINNLGAIY